MHVGAGSFFFLRRRGAARALAPRGVRPRAEGVRAARAPFGPAPRGLTRVTANTPVLSAASHAPTEFCGAPASAAYCTDSRTGARSRGGRPPGRPAAGGGPLLIRRVARERGRRDARGRCRRDSSRAAANPIQPQRTEQTPHRQHTCTRAHHQHSRTCYLCVHARGNGRRTAAWWACRPSCPQPTLHTHPHTWIRSTRSSSVVKPASEASVPGATLLGAGTGGACSAAAATRPGSQQVKPHASIDRAADARRQPGERRVPCKCCLYVAVGENRGRRVRSFLPTDRALDPIRPSSRHRINGARFIESLVEMRRR